MNKKQISILLALALITLISNVSATIDGFALYGTYCSSCHNPLSNSNKLGATAAQIQTAINNVNAMHTYTLMSLNSSQIQAISVALTPITPAPAPTPTPTPSLNGSDLYAGNCAGCHNPLSTTTKSGRTLSQIQNAITTVTVMNSLSSLSQNQLQAISIALLPLTGNPTANINTSISICSPPMIGVSAVPSINLGNIYPGTTSPIQNIDIILTEYPSSGCGILPINASLSIQPLWSNGITSDISSDSFSIVTINPTITKTIHTSVSAISGLSPGQYYGNIFVSVSI